MTARGESVLVVGAGVFGLSAAVELRRRGYGVDVLEAGEIPNPLAGGTDISKVCRLEYGADARYMEWMETAREGWLEWNAAWRRAGEPPLYHETGVLMVSLGPMRPGAFEYESFEMLRRRGHTPERLGGAELARRFPAWSPQFEDGFYHAKGGWTESGRVVEFLARTARRDGVGVHPGDRAATLIEAGGAVRGVETVGGRAWRAGHVVLACGSWLAELVPELAPALSRSYHPVWHLRPERPQRFAAERFPVFTADINNTGFYGFPFHPQQGVVKVAHHGAAVEPGPDGALTVTPELTAPFLAFLGQRMPALADAEIVSTRLCPYCDSQDEDFWIAGDPRRPGLTVAAGGSGHGFKFAPVLGGVIADAVEGVDHPLLERFRWRPEVRLEHGHEASRCHSEGELR
jgi:glycine/D-amino acid oxidase-like deaminating enzyme